MKRILLVTNIFPPMIGGPASFIDRLAHNLARRGMRVTVVCSSEQPREAADASRPFRVVRICLRVREWYEIKVRLVLLWQLLTHRLVLVNGLETYTAQICGILRRRYVLKFVGDTAWETARNRGSTSLGIDEFQADANERRRHADLVGRRDHILSFASRVVTPSHYLRGMLERLGVIPDKIRVILNGADEPPAPVAVCPRAPGTPLRVLFVGRLTNWKGVETLLLATKDLPDVEVVVGGDGPSLPSLVELSRQLGTAHACRFTGRLDARQVHEEMMRAHLLVLTSLYEGLSHTLLEAQACGLPLVASTCGGNPEVVTEGINGLLVPPLDPVALRAAIERLGADEKLRLRLAQGALVRSRDFSLTSTVDGFAQLLGGEP